MIDGVTSTTSFIALPLLPLIYPIMFALVFPISTILRSRSWSGSSLLISNKDKARHTFSMIFYSEETDIKPLFSTSSVAGALFGAVHCLAWNFDFPSYIERLLWRIASLGIVGACILSFVGSHVWPYVNDTRKNADKNSIRHKLVALIQNRLLLLIALVYPTARVVLLVLAVTSLTSLPPSALDTVNWVQLVPHF